MTPRQKQLLDFIRDYRTEHGISPTYCEMKEAMGLASKSAVHRLIDGLVQRGQLARQERMARGVTLPGTVMVDSTAAAALERAAARAGCTPSQLIIKTFGGQGE